MTHRRAAMALLALALGTAGCTGLRIGSYGIGIVPMRVRRAVFAKADWSPDDRFVLVAKRTAKSVERASFIIRPAGAWVNQSPGRAEILVVPADGSARPTRLGSGEGLSICPSGTCAAFVETADGARRLWLADYAAPKPTRTLLDPDVEHFSFSHDGKWLSWSSRADGAWRVAPVERPDQAHRLDEDLGPLAEARWTTRRWGMPRDRWRWSADGALYRLLTRWDDARRALEHRWVRFVPPEWTLDDLGERPEGVAPATLRDELPRRPHGLARSRDGTLRLKIDVVRRRRTGILFFFGMPEAHTEVANVHLVLPDRSTRQLTRFRARRW